MTLVYQEKARAGLDEVDGEAPTTEEPTTDESVPGEPDGDDGDEADTAAAHVFEGYEG